MQREKEKAGERGGIEGGGREEREGEREKEGREREREREKLTLPATAQAVMRIRTDSMPIL